MVSSGRGSGFSSAFGPVGGAEVAAAAVAAGGAAIPGASFGFFCPVPASSGLLRGRLDAISIG